VKGFGLSAVELSYSRPSVKGRKIFGDLVPFGSVWRTGANGATSETPAGIVFILHVSFHFIKECKINCIFTEKFIYGFGFVVVHEKFESILLH
jgi:hypothetical protein